MPFHFRFQDVFDILIISVLLYQLYRWFRNTRAVQVLIGLSLIALFYVVTRTMGLFMTSWILQQLGTVTFILIIVVFQQEIRQTLYRVSLIRHAFGAPPAGTPGDHAELVRGVFHCAANRTGALIVIRRQDPLAEHLSNGVVIDGALTHELIETIFFPGSPLHDGAAVIDGGRITMASCHLPLAIQSELSPGHGTRHRAALGITERSDAVVIVVSEERGAVSVAVGETLTPVATEGELTALLDRLLTRTPPLPRERRGVMEFLFADLRTKGAILTLVTLSWLILTIRQGEIVTVTAPIRFRNVPAGMVMTGSSPDELELQIKVYSNLIPAPGKLDITAEVDLGRTRPGHNTLPLSSENFKLPLGVVFSQTKPSVVRVTMEQKETRRLPVIPALTGRPQRGTVLVTPRSVRVEGASSLLSRINGIPTEAIDPRELARAVRLERKLVPPDNGLKILDEPSVIVELR